MYLTTHHAPISPPNDGQNLIYVKPLSGEEHILEVMQILEGDSDVTLYRFHSGMTEQGSLTSRNHTNSTEWHHNKVSGNLKGSSGSAPQ